MIIIIIIIIIYPLNIPCFPGLLCGDPVSNGDRHSGSPYTPNPSVVPKGYLPSRICPQGPGPDEGQVSTSVIWTRLLNRCPHV